MTVATGINGQLGYAAESTFGTAVTPTRFAEFLSEDFKKTVQRLEAQGIRAGARVDRSDRWASGRVGVDGSIDQELHNKGFGLLLKHLFGNVVTAQPDSGGHPTVFTHTFIPASLWGLSLTHEVGWKDETGTAFKKTIEGAKAKGFELSAKVGEFAKLKSEWVAEDLVAASGVTVAAYPASTTPMTFVMATLTIGGSAVDVEGFTLKGVNALDDDRYFIGSQLRKEPVNNGYGEYTLDIDAEWVDWTAYNRFINGTEAALVILIQGANIVDATYKYQLQITTNVRFDGDTPRLDERKRIMQPLKAKALDTGSGPGTAITAVYQTTDSTP